MEKKVTCRILHNGVLLYAVRLDMMNKEVAEE